MALFLLTPKQWQHNIAAKKISFLLRSVDKLSENLANLGIETRIIPGTASTMLRKSGQVAQEIGVSVSLEQRNHSRTAAGHPLRRHSLQRYRRRTSCH